MHARRFDRPEQVGQAEQHAKSDRQQQRETGHVRKHLRERQGATRRQRCLFERRRETGRLRVALHRDDYAKKGLHSQASPTSLPFEIDGARIVLVDDVLYTGRTVRAALNELFDYGRPAAVELAVLADRGGRELPVAARFAGGTLDVPADATLVLARDDAGFTLRIEAHSESHGA